MLLPHHANTPVELCPRRGVNRVQDIKQRIVNESRRGVLDHNPLLSTPHQVPCENCGNEVGVVYLDYLKSGRFELGETNPIEVLRPHALGFIYETEQETPIVIKVECERCGSEFKVRPINLEYLLFTIGREESGSLYI